MNARRPTILAVVPKGGGKEADGTKWIETDSFPAREDLLAIEWEYVYLGIDGAILDGRVLLLAAEYAARDKPDLMLFSSPSWRTPAADYRRPEDRFHVLCEMARAGGLYAFGNKLFSRRLFSRIEKPFGAAFLTEAFCLAESVSTLSQPWVAVHRACAPPDAEFFAFVERYAGFAGDGGE